MSLNIEYIRSKNYLTDIEWKSLINNYIDTIKSTNVGKILFDQLTNYINEGNIINIINYSKNKSFQYPSVCYKYKYCKYNITVCIPDTPYFTKVPIISPYLKEFKNTNKILSDIYSFQEVNQRLQDDFVKSFCIYQFQPIVVVLFHELVHVLRRLKGIEDSNLEEDATMYGVVGSTLKINGVCITENTFRQEIGLDPRVSHDCKYLHVEGTLNKIEGKTKEYWKKTFRKMTI